MRFAAISIVALMISFSAFAADPFVGKWKLNEEKSSSESGKLPNVRSYVIESISKGVQVTSTTIDGRSTTFPLYRDGKEHAASNTSLVRILDSDSVVHTSPSPNEITLLFMRKGNQVATVRRVVSGDGGHIVEDSNGVTSKGEKYRLKLVFEKQH